MQAPRKPQNPQPLAAIYARVSLEEQASNYSLPSQVRDCKKLAAEKGFATSDNTTFIDRGGLGGELDRVALTRLRDAAHMGIIAAIIVNDPDRLSRKLAHLLLLTEEFEKQNIPLHFVHGGVDATPEGKMFMSMRGAFSEFEKLKLAERVSRGRKEKAQQGLRVAGKPPYGYRYEGKQQGKRGELVAIEAQAATVRRMFTMAADGKTPLEIARALDEDGVPTVTGTRWDKAVVAGILNNRVYVGEGSYNRRESVEPKTRRKPAPQGQNKKTSQRFRDPASWIPVKVTSIVDLRLFEAAQQRRKRAAALATGRPTRAYLAKGLMRCGLCGRACYHYPNRGRAFALCGNKNRLTNERGCPGVQAWVEDIERILLTEIELMLMDPERWAERATSDLKRRAQAQRGAATEQRKLEAEIEKLRKREQRAAESLLDTELADTAAIFRQGLKDAQAKRRELEARLHELAVTALPPTLTKEFYIGFVRRHLENFHKNPRAVVEECVEAVVLQENGNIDIRFRFEPDPDEGASATNRKDRQPHACPIGRPATGDGGTARTGCSTRAHPTASVFGGIGVITDGRGGSMGLRLVGGERNCKTDSAVGLGSAYRAGSQA